MMVSFLESCITPDESGLQSLEAAAAYAGGLATISARLGEPSKAQQRATLAAHYAGVVLRLRGAKPTNYRWPKAKRTRRGNAARKDRQIERGLKKGTK